MRVRIFSTVVEQIFAHVARDHPREACGLLLGQGDRIEAVVASPNVAADPESAFEVDPALLLRAHREAREGGHAILGWYHSHPDGVAEPSAVDAARAVEDGKLWLIVAGERLALYVAGDGAIRNRFTQGSLEIVHR